MRVRPQFVELRLGLGVFKRDFVRFFANRFNLQVPDEIHKIKDFENGQFSVVEIEDITEMTILKDR